MSVSQQPPEQAVCGVIDVELGLEDFPSKAVPESPLFAARGSSPSAITRKLLPRRERFLWSGALCFHRHKTVLLKIVLVQGISYNMAKVLTHAHHRVMDYVFGTTGIFLGVCLIFSSMATLVMRNPGRSLTAYLDGRAGGAEMAKMFSGSHALDQLFDALAGLLVVNSSMNSLTWYISNLPMLPWNEVMGHYLWHVLSWLSCMVWSAFALGVYSTSQVTCKLPCCLRVNLPSLLTTQRFALLQHVATSRPVRVCDFLSFLVAFCIVARMCQDINVSQHDDNNSGLKDRRQVYATGLIICDAVRMLLGIIKPIIINRRVYVLEGLMKLLGFVCLGVAVMLAFLPLSNILVVTTAAAVLHLVGMLCEAVQLMGWLSRTWRLIALQPPVELELSDARFVHMPKASRSPLEVPATPAASLILTTPPIVLKPLRILCLDGGGSRGVIQVLMLKAFEQCCGKPVNEMFDLICGTSVGSCLGVCLSAGTSLDTAMGLLEGLCHKGSEAGPKPVFRTKSMWRLLTKGYKMDPDAILKYMDHFLKTNGFESDQSLPSPRAANGTTPVMPHFFSIATQEQGNGKWLPFIHSNYARQDQSFTVAGAKGWTLSSQLRASTAAPTFFPAVTEAGVQYVDGGISANNPTMIALQEARAIWPGRPIGCVVSLGTGQKVTTGQSQSGLTYWAGKMLSMPTDTYRIHKEVEALLPSFNGVGSAKPTYCRLEPVIPNVSLDEHRKYVLDGIKHTTAEYMSAKASKINATCALLNLISGKQLPSSCQLEQLPSLSEHDIESIIISSGGSPYVAK